MKKMMRLILLLALLFSAFLLYSVMKIKGTPSVVFPPAPRIKNMPLYRHVEELTLTIGSRSIFEYDKLTAAKEYILYFFSSSTISRHFCKTSIALSLGTEVMLSLNIGPLVNNPGL